MGSLQLKFSLSTFFPIRWEEVGNAPPLPILLPFSFSPTRGVSCMQPDGYPLLHLLAAREQGCHPWVVPTSRQGTCPGLQTSLGHASDPKALLKIHGNWQIVSGKAVIKHRKISSVHCDDLEGWQRGWLGRRSERGDTCIHTANTPHGTAETTQHCKAMTPPIKAYASP